MILLFVITACLLATVLALIAAFVLNGRVLQRCSEELSCISTGLLLTLAFSHLLPEAFEGAENPHLVGLTLWGACFALIFIEQFSGVHHHGSDSSRVKGAAPIVIGEALHTFTDGVVIASAFQASPALGWAVAAGILLHELPQEIGDFVLLTRFGLSRTKAFRLLLTAGASAVLGGVLGFFVLEHAQGVLPYALALSASSFLYIAMSELLPRLSAEISGRRGFIRQFSLLMLGAVIAFIIGAEH